MYWTFELNKLCCADKLAYVQMKNGETFKCRPDCLTYDDDGNEVMMVEMEDGQLRDLPEESIEMVTEMEGINY